MASDQPRATSSEVDPSDEPASPVAPVASEEPAVAAAPAPTPSEPEPERAPRPSEPPASEERPAGRERKNRFEALLPGIVRRGIEKSIEAGLNTFERSLETGRETTGAVREKLNEVKSRDVASAVTKALGEAKLPREIASAVLGQLDETKNDVLRILAREFREFLEATDLATELKHALTSLSFEVKTEIRFIPNDAGTGVKADVRARSRVKRTPPPPRRRRRTRRHDDE